MTSIRAHIDKLKRLRADLPGLSVSLMQNYGNDSVALRKEDSIENGINVNGQQGAKATYSTNKIPTFLFKGKELNQAGRNYVKDNPLGNWYGLRSAEGLHNKQVNLTHSGDTWKGYKVLGVVVQSKGLVKAQVGVVDSAATVFLNNVKRYGKYYLNTPAELTRLRENVDAESRAWLTSYLT